MLGSRSGGITWVRLLVATAFAISLGLSLATSLRLWQEHLYLDSDASLGNAFSVGLWLVAAILAGTLARRGCNRLGWSSFVVLAVGVAIGDATEIKDMVGPVLLSTDDQRAWILLVAPVALPLLLLASRTLLFAARNQSQRALLLALGPFVTATLLLDNVAPPIGVAEEGSELMVAAVLIGLLVSVLGWVPLSPTIITWRFMVLVVAFTTIGGGILLVRDYWIPEASTYEHRPEIDHGPLSIVSQSIVVDRAYLSRIDMWAESVAGDAELFLRLAPPGQQPIRESRTTTSHPRWSDRTVTFHFEPIPDSQDHTYEISIGALQPSPYVFIGLSTDDSIPDSIVKINGISDSWANDLALRAYTSGRGPGRLAAMIQDRSYTDGLIVIELLISWLWVVVTILWLTASRYHPQAGRSEQN